MTRRLLILIVLLLAVAARADDDWYRVRSGDYLLRIAERFGVSVQDLETANGLRNDVIHPDQRLLIPGPFRRSGGEIVWRTPFDARAGEVLRPFGELPEGDLTSRHSGVDVALPRGTRIVAPAHGVLRYLGEQEGYGRLMILDHGGGWATVLGPFDADPFVAEGQCVSRGDGLGLSGVPVESGVPYLHIELRRDHAAVDPARLLR